MAIQVTNHKCPTCTGPLHYSTEAQTLVCDFCGGAFDVRTIEEMYAGKDAAAETASKEAAEKIPEPGSPWSEAEAAGLRVYGCPSCGAELVCDAYTAATSCPYCSNPTVIPGQLGGTLKPDFVIPFKLDRKTAEQTLEKYYNGKKLLPRNFIKGNHISEIKGIYVPFWLYDANTTGDLNYLAQKVHSYRDGDYRIDRAEHFDVQRSGTIQFIQVPVNGSTKMPDTHMDAIEPFDYRELAVFSTAYLPGFLADKYDVDSVQCRQRMEHRIKNSTKKALEGTIHGYTSKSSAGEYIDVQHSAVSYALLPVWMLHTKWSGKDFLFAMNGQTGKLIGDLPVDKRKVMVWFAGIFFPLFITLCILLYGGG